MNDDDVRKSSGDESAAQPAEPFAGSAFHDPDTGAPTERFGAETVSDAAGEERESPSGGEPDERDGTDADGEAVQLPAPWARADYQQDRPTPAALPPPANAVSPPTGAGPRGAGRPLPPLPGDPVARESGAPPMPSMIPPAGGAGGPGDPGMYGPQPGPEWGETMPVPQIARQRQGPRGTTMVVAALLIALVAGSAGGFVATRVGAQRSQGTATDDYNLGTVPQGSRSRAPDSVAGIARQILPSVVSLKITGPAKEGSGSGLIIKGGYVITNNHVVAPATRGGEIEVRFHNDTVAPATIVGRDPDSDIAVIKPQGVSNLKPAKLGNSNNVVVGDPVIAIGSPLGLAGTVTYGIVSALHRPVTAGGGRSSATSYFDAIQTDAPINPGNSGGPLVNAQGNVIGVNSAIASLDSSRRGQAGSIGLGFAIPINKARRVAEQLIRTGEAHHAVIGATVDLAYEGDGARIISSRSPGQPPPIVPSGPADDAGLRAGDVIVSFDGQAIGSPRELIVAIRDHRPDQTVQLTYRRGGEKHTISITLGKSES